MSNNPIMSNVGSAGSAETVTGNMNIITIHYGNRQSDGTNENKTRDFAIFGVYESWSYCDVENPFQIQAIDAQKFTHITFAYIQPNYDGTINYVDNQNLDGKRFRPFLRLKNLNSKVKLLLSLGGWMEHPDIFSKVLGDDSKLKFFITNLVDLFEKFKFDGLNLVWLYPTSNGDKALLSKFFSKLRETDAFRDSILSVAICNDWSLFDHSRMILRCKHVDYFNVMSFGFTNSQPKTELSAPIAMTIDLIEVLLNEDIPSYKILVGLELAGKIFNLVDSTQNGIGSNCTSCGEKIRAFEIQKKMSTGTWKTVDAKNGDSSYSYSSNEWICHESVTSISHKTKYAYQNLYGGVMVSAVNYENVGDSALLDAIKNQLEKMKK